MWVRGWRGWAARSGPGIQRDLEARAKEQRRVADLVTCLQREGAVGQAGSRRGREPGRGCGAGRAQGEPARDGAEAEGEGR